MTAHAQTHSPVMIGPHEVRHVVTEVERLRRLPGTCVGSGSRARLDALERRFDRLVEHHEALRDQALASFDLDLTVRVIRLRGYIYWLHEAMELLATEMEASR